MIEKRITYQLLDTGEIILSANERTALLLPEHSTSITIELEGEQFVAQWSGRSRKISGETLLERLQEYGQEQGLLRLRAVDQVYRLAVLPPGTAMQISDRIERRKQKTSTARKAARRRTVDRQFHADSEYDWHTKENGSVGFLTSAREFLTEQLQGAGFDTLDLVKLRLQGEKLATLDNFDELLAVDVANVERMPHQEAVARHALSRLRGRAVLADEVGLGKTIEAGFAIKELTLRGLAKRVLILCPAPLREQWRDEMGSKFDLTFDMALSGTQIGNQDKLILSLTLGARAVDRLTKKAWDIVIVDEAHRAAGSGARKRRELITALTTRCRYAFFLTATPIQNDLLELYRLIELLRPGTFRSVSEFRRQYMRGNDPRTPNDPAALRRLISSAMIRTTRAQAGVDRVKRRPSDVPIDLGPREHELYALSTELLRNIMRDPADTMRRRSLALRLTASPFSMGTTALRMADRHPDQSVRAALQEIGHFAMDIQHSAREDTALRITSEWVREHGRVLIFTQHTDTVTGLLRRLGAEGLSARAFHGSMSAGERAATVAAFRSGAAPIMISTDAGAEGQNLQFCNCVLNYDLPWNPMRIEQRIGRVDRLTQPRDEVFVANLFARNTIDEQVYRLLAEKLRMFELLFGQVTTILGELDESKSATFESRVLEALFAEDDTRMARLLSKLGSELADARQRAKTLIAADSSQSSWMAGAFEHRKELTKAGSNELAPEVAERARKRQRKVQKWVREVFKALDAHVVHDTGDEEGAFLTVQFDDVVAKELAGRELLHVAFDRLGMEQHPDAELCAVGSPIFDELLALLKMRGDMHATVPVIPEDPGPSPLRHSADIRLVQRRFVSAKTWSGRATFRTTIGETELTEYVVTADVNANKKVRLPRRPLQDGESLPATFGQPAQVINEFERVAADTLDALKEDMAEEVTAERQRELQRIQVAYQAQISEAGPDDQQRLRDALSSEEDRLGRTPDIRARAKMLAFILDENDWLIEETWAGAHGCEATLTYEWGLPRPPKIKSAASQRTITILDLCCDSHLIDESEGVRCNSCDNTLCRACGEDAVFADCTICGFTCCGLCRKFTGGLCLGCVEPERVPELDDNFGVAWRLNRGVTLLVGDRVARLVRLGQPSPSLIVRDEDVDDPRRIRLRSYAIRNDLPADIGLVLRDFTDRSQPLDGASLLLHSTSTVEVEVELCTAERDGSAFDDFDASDLPELEAPTVAGESYAGLTQLLASLRSGVPPPAPPAVLLTRRPRRHEVWLQPDNLIERIVQVDDAGGWKVLDEHTAAVRWRTPSVADTMLAEAELAGLQVSVECRNEAVLVTMRDTNAAGTLTNWVAKPASTSLDDQLAWHKVLCALDVPGGRVGQLADARRMPVETELSPSECELVQRRIEPVAEIGPVEPGVELVPVDHDSLVALGAAVQEAEFPVAVAMPSDIGRHLLERSRRAFTSVICRGFEVHETWRGHGTATHVYRTFDGVPVAPKLDDIKFRLNDFGVCRDGHFYAAGTSAQCVACQTWACGACDTDAAQACVPCPGCAAQVCRRCMSIEHPVSSKRCVVCRAVACTDCGRDPQVHACPICARDMCDDCRSGQLCSACAHLVPATAELLGELPSDLAAVGAMVLVGADPDATTVVLSRGDAIEQVVLRDRVIDRWVTFRRNDVDGFYRLRLAASRRLDMQVSPVIAPLEAEVSLDEPHVVVQSKRFFYASWAADQHAEGKSLRWFAEPDSDLAHVVLEEFEEPSVLPSAAGPVPAEVEHALRGTQPVDPIEFSIRWNRVGQDVIITPSGMIYRTIGRSDSGDSISPWVAEPTDWAWIGQGWNPTPTVHAHAITDAAEAVIAGLASLLVLGIRIDGQTQWHTIVESPLAVWASSLSRLLGVEDANEVSGFVDPNQIIYSSVLNAVEVERKVQPVGGIKPSDLRVSPDTTRRAFAAWMPDETASTPEFGALPSRFVNAMKIRWQTGRYRAALTIGARIEESITVEGGRAWRHETNLGPARNDARQIDSATGRPLDAGVIDREGHFGPDGMRCAYCGERICTTCVDGLTACHCCEISLCRRCVATPFEGLVLCPACWTIRPATHKEARQHGRIVSNKGMLIGADAHHVVVVEKSDQQWLRRGNDNPTPVAPSVWRFLDTRSTQL